MKMLERRRRRKNMTDEEREKERHDLLVHIQAVWRLEDEKFNKDVDEMVKKLRDERKNDN